MFELSAIARTVRVQDLKVETKPGANGVPFQAKSILLTVASNRPYKTFALVNGVRAKEKTYPTDFMFCRANGECAQLIADWASDKTPEGKHISRHVYLKGHLETYKDIKKVDVERTGNFKGTQLKMKFAVDQERDNVIFVIHSVEFLDPKPANKAGKPVAAAASSEMEIVEVGAESNEPVTVEMTDPAAGATVGNGEVVGSLELPDPAAAGTKTCSCGEKNIDINADVCPKCGGAELSIECPF